MESEREKFYELFPNKTKPKDQSNFAANKFRSMYGLLLENLSEYVKTVFGEEKWDEVRKAAGISSTSFGVHDDYDEELLNHLAKTAQQVSFTRICLQFDAKSFNPVERIRNFLKARSFYLFESFS